jgi:hypothetical protein
MPSACTTRQRCSAHCIHAGKLNNRGPHLGPGPETLPFLTRETVHFCRDEQRRELGRDRVPRPGRHLLRVSSIQLVLWPLPVVLPPSNVTPAIANPPLTLPFSPCLSPSLQLRCPCAFSTGRGWQGHTGAFPPTSGCLSVKAIHDTSPPRRNLWSCRWC